MEPLEIRHDRYRLAPTAEIWTHEHVDPTCRDNSTKGLHKRVLHYNSEVRNGNLGVLDILFTTLCYEYQLRIQSKVRCIPEDFDDSFFRSIIQVLLNDAGNLDESTVNLLLDILVLEMVLYSIHDEIKSIASTVVGQNAPQIVSSLIDALYLNAYIHERNGGNQSGLIEIFKPLKSMFNLAPDATDEYFDLLGETINKLMVTFSTNDVMHFLWSLILTDEQDDGKDKQFKLLTIALESILSVKNNINLAYICKDDFWQLICYGLKSDAEDQRLHARYFMTIALNYVEKESIAPENDSLIPFVGCQRDDGRRSAQETKTQFFLILECLEEKQADQIHPALTQLNKLIQSNSFHATCGNCFDKLYLHCIFKRILKHQTRSVMEEGLTHLLRMHPAMYDDEFLALLIESLDNTSLYSTAGTDQLPEIVSSLGKMLYNSDGHEIDLMNRFICMAATREWSSIPFFYIIQALVVAASQANDFTINIWSLREYEAVVKMIERNIKSQTRPLQAVIANSMSAILSRCAGGDIGLDSIARILFALGHSFDYSSSNNAHLSKNVHGLCPLNYSNNPKIWGALIDHLKEKVNDQDVIAYVRRCCTELSVDATAGDVDVEYFAVMICLLAKAGKDCSPFSPYGEPLSRVFALVRDMHTRPNADMTVLVKIVELFTCLKRHAFDEDVNAITIPCPFLVPVISVNKEAFWQIIMSSLEPSRIPTAYSEARKYIACLEAILTKSLKVDDNCSQDFLQFYTEAWKIVGEFTGDVNARFWYALHIVGVCRSCKCFSEYTKQRVDGFCTIFINRQVLISTVSEECNRESGKITCECYGIISQLIERYVLQNLYTLRKAIDPILLRLHKMVEAGKEYVIPRAVQMVFQLGIVSDHTSMRNKTLGPAVINLSWSVLWQCEKSNLFWTCLKLLIDRMINSIAYGFPLSPSKALDHLEAWMLNAENTRHAKMILASEIRHTLPNISRFKYPSELSRLLHIPLTCFLEINEEEEKIETNLQNLCRETLKGHPSRKEYLDVYHRACCVSSIIYAMKNDSVDDSIANTLLAKLKDFEGMQYVGNSQVHRQKHRVMQLLLLSHPHWSEATLESVYENICHFIVHETDHPTVRVMQQWLLVLIYIKNPAKIGRVWKLLQQGKDNRPESILSIATIIYHLSEHLPFIQEQRSFSAKAIRELLPSSFSREFIIDLFLRFAVSNFLDKPEYELIKSLRWQRQRNNVENHLYNLTENFLFTSFDPIKNFDIQTIFYDLPRLLGMCMDECIDPSDLKESSFSGKVLSPESKLNSLSIPHQLLDRPYTADEKLPGATRQSDAGLIIVASLVGRPENLGGLVKSAEIFGAETVVLDNLACTEDPEFQALSPERKITLSEVKLDKLRDYLAEKKSLGWRVVGVEESSNSARLLDTEFNMKTVLLLGNEGSGIPADLISLLDVSVKINEIRRVPLNVHVAGAICMWHYAKKYNL